MELFAERVENRAACAMAQAESLRYKLLGGLAVRRACYGVVRFIMENGVKGLYKWPPKMQISLDFLTTSTRLVNFPADEKT